MDNFLRKTTENMNTSTLSPSNLGSSPGQRISESENSEASNTSKFMNRIKSDLQVQKVQESLDQELHQKRVQNLRKELDYLKSTEWKYKSVDL